MLFERPNNLFYFNNNPAEFGNKVASVVHGYCGVLCYAAHFFGAVPKAGTGCRLTF